MGSVNREEAIARIRTALKKRTGRSWSVTGGRGTVYGWITIHAFPKEREACRYLSAEDQRALRLAIGIGTIVGAPEVTRRGISVSPTERYAFVVGLEQVVADLGALSASTVKSGAGPASEPPSLDGNLS